MQSTIESKSFLRAQLYFGIFLVALVVGVNALAHDLSLYWIYDWFDNPMHVSGGVAIGYISIFLWRFFVMANLGYSASKLTRMSNPHFGIFGSAVLGAFIFGLLWEFLEISFGLSGFSNPFLADTIKDLINDMMGGIIAAMIWTIVLHVASHKLKNK